MTFTWNRYSHKVIKIILTGVRDPKHTDSLALFAFNIGVLRANPIQQIYQHFVFGLTCDVTGVTEVIKVCFPSTVFQIPNAACIFRIGPVDSDVREGSK